MSAPLIIALALLQYGPGLARALVEIFRKPEGTITAADWEKVFALAEKPYDEYVPAEIDKLK